MSHHQKSVHPKDPADPKPFVCGQCGSGYGHKAGLRRYERMHPPDYQGLGKNGRKASYVMGGRELLS